VDLGGPYFASLCSALAKNSTDWNELLFPWKHYFLTTFLHPRMNFKVENEEATNDTPSLARALMISAALSVTQFLGFTVTQLKNNSKTIQ